MSFVKKAFKSVTGLLGLSAPKVHIPDPVIPAAPAPTARTDAGASISIGSTSDNSRVSGGGVTKRKVDPLGGLGLGGLNIG